MEFQLQHHSFQRNPRADLLQNGLVGSPCSPRHSQESSPTPQFKNINSLALSLLHSPTLSHPHMTTGKTIALTRRTLVGKVMSLLLNMLSRLVITFLPRSKHYFFPINTDFGILRMLYLLNLLSTGVKDLTEPSTILCLKAFLKGEYSEDWVCRCGYGHPSG